MARSLRKKHVKSKYKHVRGWIKDADGNVHWCVSITGVSQTEFKTERLAAIAADKYLISKRKEPVNILVRK
tara:strand:+ start:299 stop:511 length:213 start_codon:yes stop_codon:yes gene_type:complete